ncbi:MAG: alpha/beta hydrolase family protein [Salinivirgaceae bacterium]
MVIKLGHLFRYFLMGFVVITLLYSCTKDEAVKEADKQLEWIYSISAEAVQSFLTMAGQAETASLIKYPVDIYRFEYPMVYREQQIKASGIIGVPQTTTGSFPVLCFQHGTLVTKKEAPSLSINTPQNLTIAGLAGAGYVLLIPDLIGFGASDEYFHPYLVKQSNVKAVDAMLEAVHNLPSGSFGNINVNDSLFLSGYSQGGWLTLALLEHLEQNSSLPWNIIATACGAGPYNPELVLDYVLNSDTYLKPFFLPYVMLSFIEDGTIYGNMDKYFKEPYATRIPELYDGLKTGDEIDAALTKNPQDLFTAEMFSYKSNSGFEEIRTSFEKNRVTAWKTTAPLLFIHGANDVYIPQILSDSIFSDFIDAGALNVEYDIIAGADHNSAAAPAIGRSLIWFDSFRSFGLLVEK